MSHKATASVVQIYTSRLLLLLLLGLFLIRPRRAFLLRGIIIVTSTVTNTIATTNTILTTASAGRRWKIAHAGTHAAGRVSPVGRLDGQDFRLRWQRRRSLLVVTVATAAAAARRTGRAATSGAAATAGARRQVVLLMMVVLVLVLMTMVRRMIDGTVNEVRADRPTGVSAYGFVMMVIGWSRSFR